MSKEKEQSDEVEIIDKNNKKISPINKKEIRKKKIKNALFLLVWIYFFAAYLSQILTR